MDFNGLMKQEAICHSCLWEHRYFWANLFNQNTLLLLYVH